MRLRLAVLCTLGLVATPSFHVVRCQATQAAADVGARPRVPQDTLRKYRELVVSRLLQLRVALAVLTAESRPALANLTEAFARAVAAGDSVQSLSTSDPALEAQLRTFDVAMLNLEATTLRVIAEQTAQKAIAERTGVSAATFDANLTAARSASAGVSGYVPMPAFPHTLEVKVAFTVGAGVVVESDNPVSLDIGTNLVGSVLGGALGALGAPDELRNYFAKNLAVGIGLPVKKKHRIGSGYSLGLGSAQIKDRTLWPVLAMQQIDSSASDLPSELRSRDASQAAWSVPYLGVALTLHSRSTVDAKLAAGEFVPIFTVAVRLPYYYPGNAAAAFGALFTDNVSKYIGASKAVVVFGISFPLLRSDQ